MRLLPLVLVACVWAQQTGDYELRPNEDGHTSKLVALVKGREVNVATAVKRVWRGWHQGILLYTEAGEDGREKLMSFNTTTGLRHSVTSESSEILDVTVAQLDSPKAPVLVLFLRDRQTNYPGLALADPQTGTFRREERATAGAILNQTIAIRYFTEHDLQGAKDWKTVKPSREEIVPLRGEPATKPRY